MARCRSIGSSAPISTGYGASAELAAVIAEGAFWSLDAPVRRLAALDVPVPFSPPLEDVTVPTPDLVAQTARELCGKA